MRVTTTEVRSALMLIWMISYLASLPGRFSSCLQCVIPTSWVQGSQINNLPLYQQLQGPALPTAAQERLDSRALWERMIY